MLTVTASVVRTCMFFSGSPKHPWAEYNVFYDDKRAGKRATGSKTQLSRAKFIGVKIRTGSLTNMSHDITVIVYIRACYRRYVQLAAAIRWSNLCTLRVEATKSCSAKPRASETVDAWTWMWEVAQYPVRCYFLWFISLLTMSVQYGMFEIDHSYLTLAAYDNQFSIVLNMRLQRFLTCIPKHSTRKGIVESWPFILERWRDERQEDHSGARVTSFLRTLQLSAPKPRYLALSVACNLKMSTSFTSTN